MPKKPASEKQIESLVHDEASRRNIPPAEFQTMVRNQEKTPIQVAYERRNPDLDPQLIWRGKDLLDESPLVVNAPPLYIQEKIHPKVLIDDLRRRSKEESSSQTGFVEQMGLFDTIKGEGGEGAKTEFYQHDQNWSNRMILGDSLQVMSSLAEREGLRGKVQCIYFDPPYGIKFNSNFQWSTASRDVKDGKSDHITREPEQVKAFRDTWKDGVHSYLAYIRDRLHASRDLLTDSGSIIVQIGDENVHRVRAVLDEVFGAANLVSQIAVAKTASATSDLLPNVSDYLLWYAKSLPDLKYRQSFQEKSGPDSGASEYKYVIESNGVTRPMTKDEKQGMALPAGADLYRPTQTTSQRPPGSDPFSFEGRVFIPSNSQYWKTSLSGLKRLGMAGRLIPRDRSISYLRRLGDFPVMPINNIWLDTRWGFDAQDKRYVAPSARKVDASPSRPFSPPGGLMETFNASLQRDRES